MNQQILKALCGTEKTAVFMVRIINRDDSVEIEHRRYTDCELAEVFSDQDLHALAVGEFVTVEGKGWTRKQEFASAAALFCKALEG